MARVLQISANVSPLHGGPPELALNLNRALRDHGHEARILTSDALLSPDEVRRLRELFPATALHLCRSRRRIGEKLEWFRALRRALRDRPVVHIHGYYLWQTAMTSLACQWYRVPYLVHCHGIFEPYQTNRSRRKKAVFDALVGRRLISRTAGLVFDTTAEQDAAMLPGEFPNLPSFVIPPCPAQDAQLPPLPSDGKGVEPVVLFLARIAPIKRVDLAVAAMPTILDKIPTARLRIAGSDDEGLAAVAIQQLPADARESISLEGFLQGEQKSEILARSSVYVLPSENENFGISVAEALLAGLPVAISRHVGLAPAVERAGAGVILRELSAEGVAAGVLDVLSDPVRYSRMQRAARTLGQTLYSARATVDLAQEAYQSATAVPDA